MSAEGSWFGGLGELYSKFWKLIIRPPRRSYKLSDLGPPRFQFDNKGACYSREDVQLRNDRGHLLECSHFLPADAVEGKREARSSLPCVVYLHGNGSCRCEAFDILPALLPRNISVFCFDFSGAGKSEGEYVTLGYYERLDVKAVIDHLRTSDPTRSIGLWGRSMGASTAVLAAEEDPSIIACVMDSPFSSFPVVVEELISNGPMGIPPFLLRMGVSTVAQEVESRAGFAIDDLVPMREAPAVVAAGFFATGEDDTFVLPHHTVDLFEAWGAEDKKMVTFKGGHCSERPDWFLTSAAQFLQERLESGKPRSAPAGRAPAPRDPGLRPKAQQAPAPPQPAPPPAGAMSPSRSGLAAQLAAMGFDEAAVGEALQRHSSVEAAIEWMTSIAAGAADAAQGLMSANMRPPDKLGHLGEAAGDGGPQGNGDVTPTVADATAVAPDLVGSLLQLGVSEADAREAKLRCSSVEAALGWLADCGKL